MLVLGGAWLLGLQASKRQVGDLHVALVQEGLRRQWLPRNEDSDGRQLPEPPFVRGDNAAWAMTRARTLARELLQRTQRERALSRQLQAGVANTPPSGASPSPRRPC